MIAPAHAGSQNVGLNVLGLVAFEGGFAAKIAAFRRKPAFKCLLRNFVNWSSAAACRVN